MNRDPTHTAHSPSLSEGHDTTPQPEATGSNTIHHYDYIMPPLPVTSPNTSTPQTAPTSDKEEDIAINAAYNQVPITNNQLKATSPNTRYNTLSPPPLRPSSPPTENDDGKYETLKDESRDLGYIKMVRNPANSSMRMPGLTSSEEMTVYI